jgi:nucleoside-triphosphatase
VSVGHETYFRSLERSPVRVLLEGRPGVGKTTAAWRLARLLTDAGVPVAGFVTQEIRKRGRRLGFRIESLRGGSGILAHVDLPGPPRVGKYGVDLEAFERIAIPALSETGEITVIDELGKMELASESFREAVSALFDKPFPIVATVHAYRHPFTDALKDRADVETLPVNGQTRDGLPGCLAERFSAS